MLCFVATIRRIDFNQSIDDVTYVYIKPPSIDKTLYTPCSTGQKDA